MLLPACSSIGWPCLAIDCDAASRIRTTRRPAWPSEIGVLLGVDALDEVPRLDLQRLDVGRCGAHMSPVR